MRVVPVIPHVPVEYRIKGKRKPFPLDASKQEVPHEIIVEIKFARSRRPIHHADHCLRREKAIHPVLHAPNHHPNLFSSFFRIDHLALSL